MHPIALLSVVLVEGLKAVGRVEYPVVPVLVLAVAASTESMAIVPVLAEVPPITYLLLYTSVLLEN